MLFGWVGRDDWCLTSKQRFQAFLWLLYMLFAKNSLTFLGKSFLNNAILVCVMNMRECDARKGKYDISSVFVLALCCMSTAGDMLVKSIY